ncbi:integral membrane protein TIGR01906 [Thermoanaerobacter uzonensis DSM 18761]|uniref:Integral membrane protein TIGR01906 n=1 Tax=Thermoanaerobacter uzonensis DSM 18761 TaxID=1123369 RepID=A0A1M4VWJ7_9THEO|nr:TIGR01906 family membrane protein [Thermoanaerobacter uzonensis]SHE73243.1 integral membrane protein TIGR01906 [Thermoanaerobacter uzonensis DSM 18761]
MVRKIIHTFLSSGMVVSLFLAVFLTSLQYVAFNGDFYKEEYKKNNVMSVTGMNIDELMKVTKIMQKYLMDKEETLDVMAKINGSMQRMFNDRELAHMKDVKNLFQMSFLTRNISIIVFILIFTYFLFTKSFYKAFNYLLKGTIFIIIFLLVFVLAVTLNFDNWFTGFHLVFFDNDLWQLNAETDRLIQMFPLEFFQDAVFVIFRNTFFAFVVILGILYGGVKMAKKPVF